MSPKSLKILQKILKGTKFYTTWSGVRAVRAVCKGDAPSCPIVTAANKKAKKRKYGNGDYHKAAIYIGIPEQDIRSIVDAADNPDIPEHNRKDLVSILEMIDDS
ncbi:hypothetical protein C4565_00645 [Candidatus Parcubacteria bacterium]|nr:MAG: hypothetical protein C4565_00645 [Candidatus Parcubacteria bacterium]